MLCGISSRFQLLSPSERQVAHALLTRPPLSHWPLPPKIPLPSFVRLACVRHAASVHPEPGSNSLNFLYYLISRCYNLIQSLISLRQYWLVLSLFSRLSSLKLEFTVCLKVLTSSNFFRVPLFLSLFGFQCSCYALLSDSSISISLSKVFVNTFLKVFLFFLKGWIKQLQFIKTNFGCLVIPTFISSIFIVGKVCHKFNYNFLFLAVKWFNVYIFFSGYSKQIICWNMEKLSNFNQLIRCRNSQSHFPCVYTWPSNGQSFCKFGLSKAAALPEFLNSFRSNYKHNNHLLIILPYVLQFILITNDYLCLTNFDLFCKISVADKWKIGKYKCRACCVKFFLSLKLNS